MSHYRWGRFALAVCGALLLLFLASLLVSCGSSSTAPSSTPPPPPVPLTAADVQQVVENAAQSLNVPMVVAVSDRAGTTLAVFQNAGAPATSTGNFGVAVDSQELAVALARTAAYFSNDQAPLSSRTVRFISGVHFPPGVIDAPNGDLYGIENTNRGCPLNTTFLPGQNINPARSIDGLSLGLGIITGKADTMDSDPTAVNPGGVPLFKNGHVVGGVGVVSTSSDAAEFAAFSGASQSGFLPSPSQLPPPGVVIIGGITLPFVNQTNPPNGIGPGTTAGTYTLGPQNGGLPPVGDLVATVGGVSKFSRCEAPFLLQYEIECRITPSLPAQKPWTPRRFQTSSQAAPRHSSHLDSGLYGFAVWTRPVWPGASSESPGSRGPSRTRS
jgi:uncharacterized protein GlcG (DUF336 family)